MALSPLVEFDDHTPLQSTYYARIEATLPSNEKIRVQPLRDGALHWTNAGNMQVAIEELAGTRRIVRATSENGDCVDVETLERISHDMNIPCVKEQRMTRFQIGEMLRKMDGSSSLYDPSRRGFVLHERGFRSKSTHKTHLHEYFGSKHFMLDLLAHSTFGRRTERTRLHATILWIPVNPMRVSFARDRLCTRARRRP